MTWVNSICYREKCDHIQWWIWISRCNRINLLVYFRNVDEWIKCRRPPCLAHAPKHFHQIFNLTVPVAFVQRLWRRKLQVSVWPWQKPKNTKHKTHFHPNVCHKNFNASTDIPVSFQYIPRSWVVHFYWNRVSQKGVTIHSSKNSYRGIVMFLLLLLLSFLWKSEDTWFCVWNFRVSSFHSFDKSRNVERSKNQLDS